MLSILQRIFMKRLISLILIFSLCTGVSAQPPDISSFPRIRLTDSVECTSVKDQGGSPTCWVFGTNSLFESDLIKQYDLRLNLSEMFVARYAYIDKARRFLESGGTTYFEGGGQFHDVIRVIKKYGIVPEEVYNGKTDEKFWHDHAGLDTAMKVFTHGLLSKGRKDLSSDDLRLMNDTLDKYLGRVPAVFTWKQKNYTPLSFAKEVLRFADDYVELVSFADKPLYKQFILADKYNWANDSFWNISLADMQMLVDTALHKGWSVGWEGDVTETGFNFWDGLPGDGACRYRIILQF
jgi:bleomycin hydrolase